MAIKDDVKKLLSGSTDDKLEVIEKRTRERLASLLRRFCYTRFIRVHCFRCNQQTFQPSWTGRDVFILSRRTIYGIP